MSARTPSLTRGSISWAHPRTAGQHRIPARGEPYLSLRGVLVAVAVIIVIDVPGYKAGVGGEPGPATLPILIAVLCTIAQSLW
ncbi:hypothetical protein [Georgenia sp. SUBG003]|uniref:hypothetical protein n=1 Tax=Georgenia sp. SUBG003 TaxID=1497974 RepID=UPI003AB2CB3E